VSNHKRGSERPRAARRPVPPNHHAQHGVSKALAALRGEGDALPVESFAALQEQWRREDDAKRSRQAELPLGPSA
jgi:hypothetical protein